MKYTQQIFVILLLSIGFLPKFGGVDNMASQWLFLSTLNLLYFGISLANGKKNIHLVKHPIMISYLVFFIIALFSTIVALNKVESIIELSRSIILISSIWVFYDCLKKSKTPFVKLSFIVTALLGIEVLYYFVNLYISSNWYGIPNTKGIASNINIEAISILLKIPFALYLYLNTNKTLQKTLSVLCMAFGASILFIISSRASFLALLLVTVITAIGYRKSLKSLIKPFIALGVGFILTVFYINPAINSDGGRLNNLSVINESSLTRLNFYEEALQSITQNPFLGVGVGNWKLFSIKAHKELVTGYIVPYHAHNDFLQIAAEIGVLGVAAYLMIFVFVFMGLYKGYRNGYEKEAIVLLSFMAIYFVDAMLNFPISRPIIQMPLMFVLAVVISWKTVGNYKKWSKWVSLSFILLLLPTSFAAYKVLDSFRKQEPLLKDFGNQKFTTPLEYIASIDDNFPNIGATTLPIKSLKANYYKNDSIVNRLLDLASRENPFIKYPQALKSIRLRSQNLDSSLYYAKNAFEGIPQNELHVINYLSVLTLLKDSLEADRVFDRVKKMNSINIWNAYMLTNITLERELNPDLEKIVKESLQLFPKDERFKLYKMRLANGDSIIGLANNTFNEATELFEKKNYTNSAQLYLKASKLLPEDPAYLENAGHAYYLNNQNNKALSIFDSVINHYSNGTGKAEYLKGLMLFETKGVVNEACDLFQKAIRKGNEDAKKAQNLLCK